MKRAAEIERLRDGTPPDVLVIGGGIAGAGVALEAARAGARVALVEARDFASGTSSRSSKLVHGGLRYIAQGQVGLTRESVRERNALLHDAPGLVQPLRFLLPVRRGDKNGRRLLGIGLALYDAFAGRRTRAWYEVPALLERVPPLGAQDLLGGWSYLDAQTDDARLVLRVLAEACRHGAQVLNHVRVEALTHGNRGVDGAALHDTLGNQRFAVQARCVVNATGVWADELRGGLGREPKLRPLRGSHLLLPAWRLPVAQAVAFFHPKDGRPVFALPWEGATLVGTTDLDHREPLDREPGITPGELHYLLQALQHQFPALGLGAADVVSTWSGVRPVVASGQAVDPSKEAREHLVVEEGGLVTVTGGKLTTFRSSAVQALALAAHRVPALKAVRPDAQVFAPVPMVAVQAMHGLPADLAQRWLSRFGAHAPEVRACALDGELDTIAPTDIAWAELRWACRSECVGHLDDLLLRRTRLGLLLRDGAAALLPRIKPIVQQELRWDEFRWEVEEQRYRELIARCYAVPQEEGR